MIEYSNKKLLKNYPFSRAVAFCFVDCELSKKDKEYFESKIRKYEPLIKGVRVNKELFQIKFDSNKANITLTLHISHYILNSLDEITENVKAGFIDYYNDIKP